MASAADAYERNVHYELTRYLAASAGLKQHIAVEIATADQRTDDDPATWPWTYVGRRDYHFVSARRLAELRAEALSSCGTTKLGQYLHALEDSFSHEGYRVGQYLFEFDALAGQGLDPTVDWTHWNVSKALDMARVKFFELVGINLVCPGLRASSPGRWDDIEQIVRNFLAQSKPGKLP